MRIALSSQTKHCQGTHEDEAFIIDYIILCINSCFSVDVFVLNYSDNFTSILDVYHCEYFFSYKY